MRKIQHFINLPTKTNINLLHSHPIMTELVATIANDKPGQVQALIKNSSWDKVFLIGEESLMNLDTETEIVKIPTDESIPLTELSEKIAYNLRGIASFSETAVNLICGSGKLHMATISALLKSGCGIRLVAYTKEGITEI